LTVCCHTYSISIHAFLSKSRELLCKVVIIHGVYWHDKFGQKWSNGCVNVDPQQAEKLYKWADIGIKIIMQD